MDATRTLLAVAAAGLALLGVAPGAAAQDAPPAPLPAPPLPPPPPLPPGTTPPEPPRAPEAPTEPTCADDPLPDFPHRPMARVLGQFRRDFEADLEGGRGRLDLVRAILDVEGAVPVTPRFSVGLGGGVLLSRYDFSDPDGVEPGPGRLVEDTTEARLLPIVAWEITPEWQVFGAGYLGAGWATGADWHDGLWGGAGLAVRRAIDLPFGIDTVTVGAAWKSSIEAEGYWVPMLSFGGGGQGRLRVMARGAGVGVGYGFTDRFALGVSARYDRHEYRMAGSDRVPHGVFRDLRIPVGIDVDWRPSKRVTISGSLAVNVYTEIELDDEDGDRVDRFRAGPSLVGGLQLTVLF